MKYLYPKGFSCYGKSRAIGRLAAFLLLMLALPFVGTAGSFNMKNGTVVSSCSDYFYDSGGPFSDYTNLEHKVLTIYPSVPGSKVTVDFTDFYLEDYYDYLYIYNGSSTSASYIGSYTSIYGPGTITSTAADGSLTFEFISDMYEVTSGWEATVSCSSLSACSGSITAGTATASITTACPGVPVTLALSGFTAASGITYQWDTSSTGTGGWAPVTGATTVPFIYTPPAGRTLYYRCRTECTASGSTSTSSTVSVSVTGSSLPYTENFESTSYGTFPACTYNTYAGYYDGFYVHSSSSRPSWYPSVLSNHTSGGSNFLLAGYRLGLVDYTPDYFFTPGFNLESGKTYQFSYWYVTDGYGPYTAGAYIGNAQNKGAMTTALTPDFYPNNTTYQQYVANFTVPTTGFYFVGIKISQGTYYYGMALDDIGLTELPPCSGTPAYAGKANVTPTMICSSPGTVTLSVTGTPPVSGLTFQWYQANALTGPWTAISGATSTPYSLSGVSTSKYFYCAVGCSAGGSTKNTDTVQVKIAPLTPPYVETFESGTMGVNMPCASYTYGWDGYNYWYIYDGAHPYSWITLGNHTPGGSKWLFAGGGLGYSSGAEYWFTPAINFTAGKAYTFSYWYKTDGYDTYTFGARFGNSQSASAMTNLIGSDVTTSTTSFTKFSGDFVAGSTGATYIGIKYKTSNWYYGSTIDDIGLDQLPPCSAKPTAGSAKASPGMICSPGASGTTLTLTGLSAASDLTYQWQVSTAGGAPGTFTNIAGATTPSYNTAAISVASCFRCVVTCPLIGTPNADTSASVCVNIAPITPPYVETFESATAGVNQPCASYTYSWESGTGTTDFYYWGIKDAPGTYYRGMANHTPGGSKYLSAGYYIGSYALGASSGDQQYWFSPGLALTGGMAYKCSYWYAGGETYVSVNYGLYYGTSQSASAMNPMRADVTGENSTTYKQIVGSFTAPTTGTYYLGVKVNHTKYGAYGAAIDDIGVEQLPMCTSKPSAGTISGTPTLICSTGTAKLAVSGTTMASGLTFQWQSSCTSPYATWTTIAGATSSVYTTPTLSAKCCYRCIVTCSATGQADTTASYCQEVGAITPPYIETFETGTEGSNMPCASYTYSWGAGTYWYIYGGPYDSYYSAIINHTPGGKKYLYGGYGLGYYSGSDEFWFSPAIALTSGATYEFSYWYNGSNYSGGSTNLGMYYGTSQSKSAMVAVRGDLIGVNTATYKQMIGRFVAPTTDKYYLGIKLRHTMFTYPGVVIDDIGLNQLPPCTGVPTAGTISASPAMLCSAGGTVGLDMDMATVSKASGLSYTWEWTTTPPVGSTFSTTGRSAAMTTPLYTSPSLSSTTWFRMIVKCTLTGDSVVTAPIKVDVGVITPPYIETFETGTPGINMPCASYTYAFGYYYYWNVQGTPMTYSTSPLDNHTPGGSKYLIAGYALNYYSGSPEFWFTPAIKFTAGKLYQLSYWYQTDGYPGCTYGIATFMGNAQTKAAMTTPIGAAISPTNTVYKQYKTQFTPSSSGNFYIGFRQSQSGWGYGLAIDDIGLAEVPPCTDLATVDAGKIFGDPGHVCTAGGSALLDLEGSSLATGLTIEWYSASSAAGPWTSTGGTGVPYTSDPLSADTWFKAVVTCVASGAADTTDAFKVGVGGFDLPYKEDFDSIPAGTKPLCSDATIWGLSTFDGWRVYGGTYTENYKNHTPGGKNFLFAGYYLGSPSSTSEDNYWFTPGLNMRSGYKYNLSFYYVAKVSWSSTGSKIGVYYGKTQTTGGMTTNLIPYRHFTNTDYELYDTSFTMPAGGTYYFGFRRSGLNPTSDWSYYGMALDDINLNYAPCDALPMAGTITSDKPSGTQFCPGTPIKLTDIGATISLVPGIKYQWQRQSLGTPGSPWMNIAGATDTVLAADSLVGYRYRLAVICGNTHDTALSPDFLVPNYPPHPAVSITPATTPFTFCLGDTVKFSATNFTGATYDWMLDSVVIPGWKFSDLGATLPGRYMVRVTSAASPCPAYSNQVVLLANDPGYSVDITKPSDSIICAGSSVTLSGTGSKSGLTYQWRKDNVSIPGATGTNFVVTTSGYYRLVATDGASLCPAVSRNVYINVKPNPPAIISVPGGTLTACEEEGVRLDANLGGFSYQWMRGGSPVVSWVDSSVIINVSGTYSVKVRTPDGCTSTSTSVTVNILPSPTPVIVRTGDVLSTTIPYLCYQWILDGKDIPGATGATYTVVKNGFYKVRVCGTNNCKGESTPAEVTDKLMINEPQSASQTIKLYPNPTSGKVTVSSPIDLNIEVKDAAGRSVMKVQNAKEIDLSKFADGVYMFILNHDDEFIKQERVSKLSK